MPPESPKSFHRVIKKDPNQLEIFDESLPIESAVEKDSFGMTRDEIFDKYDIEDINKLKLFVETDGNIAWFYEDHYADLKNERKKENISEIFKKHNTTIHESLLKERGGKWLACGIPVEKFILEREKIAHQFRVAIEYLSLKDDVWYVLYHREEIPIQEWEQRKELTVVDVNGKSGKEILNEYKIDIAHIKELVLVNDQWMMYRLDKFFTLNDWKTEIKWDEEYNQNNPEEDKNKKYRTGQY